MTNNNTLDIMLDLETLGNSNSPVIVQLAAVCFKIEEGKPLDSFNELINPSSCGKVGLTCSGDTMDFWLKQDSELIKKIICKAINEGKELSLVLEEFSKWIKDMMKKHNCKYVKVYGNGPAADCVWIRSAYKACKMENPWMYWDDVCVRTFKDIAIRKYGLNIKKDIPFVGEMHNAIDDCKHQIKIVSTVFNHK